MPFDNFDPPADLRNFLDAFVDEFREVTEIWLFGSRAEGLVDARDWDLLVFSDDRLTPEAVSPAVHFRSDEFTIFIAVRDIFRRPWPRTKDGITEQGSFASWKWKFDGNRATYDGSADKPNRHGGWKPALRIWQRFANSTNPGRA